MSAQTSSCRILSTPRHPNWCFNPDSGIFGVFCEGSPPSSITIVNETLDRNETELYANLNPSDSCLSTTVIHIAESFAQGLHIVTVRTGVNICSCVRDVAVAFQLPPQLGSFLQLTQLFVDMPIHVGIDNHGLLLIVEGCIGVQNSLVQSHPNWGYCDI